LPFFSPWLSTLTLSFFSISLKDFKKFADTAEALSSTTAVIEGKVNDTLEAFLKKSVVQKGIEAKLAVQDKKLGQAIKDKFSSIDPVSDPSALELFRCAAVSSCPLPRSCPASWPMLLLFGSILICFPFVSYFADALVSCIRFQLNDLLNIEGFTSEDMQHMQLGLAHSLGRYKLKFSPDKVDVMIVQAICTHFSRRFVQSSL